MLASAVVLGPNDLQFPLRVTKTKPIRVRPLQTLLQDTTFMNKLLLNTLEGQQMLRANALVCLGDGGDVWQQDSEKLHKTYSATELLLDGWVVFTPKPENERMGIEYLLDGVEIGQGRFAVKARWGTRQADGTFLQFGKSGDYILRSLEDPDDIWIVDRERFMATYESI